MGRTSRHKATGRGGARRPSGHPNPHRPKGREAAPGRAGAPGRGSALCSISDSCGSCPRIGVPYAEQLSAKQRFVEDLFADLMDEGCLIEPVLGMEEPLRYRNKIAAPFAPGRKGPGKGGRATSSRKGDKPSGVGARSQREIVCGQYAAGSHRIIPIERCPVENPVGRQVVSAVRSIMQRYGMEPYDEDAGTGFVRHVLVRVGHESGEVLATIVTNAREFPGAKNFCRELVKRCPAVTTIVQNVNLRQTNVILGDEERVLYGPGFILDTLCGLSFRISSHSFYQVNAVQTEVLYRTAIELVAQGLQAVGERAPGERAAGERSLEVFDAYCGTGTIGLVAAHLLKGAFPAGVRVTGVDTVESAIRDARLNARHNGIEPAEFFAEDAGVFLQRAAAQGKRIDALIMDPPRAGASEEFIQAAVASAPTCIVYISCNPKTQARDVALLRQGGYLLRRVVPVDMFPHTDHIESVALLVRAAE